MLQKLIASLDRQTANDCFSETLVFEGHEVAVRRSTRRKKSWSMRFDADQLIVMTPLGVPDADILHWLASKKQWIARQAEKAVPQREYRVGEQFWFLGQQLELAPAEQPQKSTISLVKSTNGSGLLASPNKATQPEKICAGIHSWYQREAADFLPQRFDALVAQTGFKPSGLEIKYYKSRWGSCTSKRVIQLNWRLMMVPETVIDYVIIHELCHLKHFNHSKAFWALVEKHCPDHRAQRRWLKDHASELTLP